jgi:tRNA-Thr(GGU) m(6)t(6)A37 methyltransferase TsaA
MSDQKMSDALTLRPIGHVASCFREKFGIPRQAGLAPAARARIRLAGTEEMREAVRGLASFSHLWVIFVFHDVEPGHWKPLVRPPRLGGAKKTGVLATRSPHRPNPIGLSAVALLGVHDRGDAIELEIGGADLLDGTPVLDIKPYVPYADAIPGADAAWAAEEPARLHVQWDPRALADCRKAEAAGHPELQALIEQMVALDPRPAFQAQEDAPAMADYAAKVADFDVHWTVGPAGCVIRELRST